MTVNLHSQIDVEDDDESPLPIGSTTIFFKIVNNKYYRGMENKISSLFYNPEVIKTLKRLIALQLCACNIIAVTEQRNMKFRSGYSFRT